jgi:hypothetical protein
MTSPPPKYWSSWTFEELQTNYDALLEAYKEQQSLLGPQQNDIHERNTDGHEAIIFTL